MTATQATLYRLLTGREMLKAAAPIVAEIDRAAKGADRAPTESQRRAGNYAKGHVRLHGLDVTIENPKGSTRSGVSHNGKRWSTTMRHHYGYIKRTEGADGDHVDVFIGPHPESELVFVIDQVRPDSGRFDEHKVVLGARSKDEARLIYLANYARGWQGCAGITPFTVEQFKAWLDAGDTTSRLTTAINRRWYAHLRRALGLPVAKAAEQLALFSSGVGTIKQSGKNRLGVDKHGRTHWVANALTPPTPIWSARRAGHRAEVAELKDRWRRHEAWCEDFAQQAVEQRKAIRWDSVSGLEYLLVTRDTHPNSEGWRVTRFDPQHGPTGHVTGATPGKALIEALTATHHREEVQLVLGEEFDRMTRTPDFLHGMRRVGLLQQLNRLLSLATKPENGPKQEALAVHWRRASDALAEQDLEAAERHLRAGLEHGRIVKAVLFLKAREIAAYPRKRLVLKAHIKAFTRTNPKTGQTIQVREHNDKRTAARPTMGAARQPAAAPAPPAPRYPAPQQQSPQHRYATIHTGGPDSPGHAVRLQPHPQKAGVWQLHPDDKERVRHLMTPPKPGQQQPAPQQQAAPPAPQAAPAMQTPQMAEPKSPPPPGQFYAPDPTHSTHPTGVADAARVGVPAMQVPPPPSEIPRLPNLAPDERRAEESFASAFEADPDGVARRYLDALTKGEVGDAPNIFATDDAKVLSGDWNPQGVSPDDVKVARSLYNTAVHQTANAIAKRAFSKYLDNLAQLPEDDPKRHVLVTAGGVAAGKGYALANIGEVNAISKMVGAVWDSAGEQNSTELPWVLEECRKRKLKMTAVYVHSDPSQTWENPDRGVVERAQKKGRMVDARVFADSYTHGASNFKAFADHAQQNNAGDVSIYFIDNTSAKPTLSQEMPSAALTLDPEALYHRSLDYLQKASVGGHIKRGGSSGTRIWGPPQVGRHGQAQRSGQANQQAAPGAPGATPPQPGGQPQAA